MILAKYTAISGRLLHAADTVRTIQVHALLVTRDN